MRYILLLLIGCDSGSLQVDDWIDSDTEITTNETDTDDIPLLPTECNGSVVRGDFSLRSYNDIAPLLGVEILLGDITVHVDDLRALYCLEEIHGSLYIEDTQLQSLEGLESLTMITDSLVIKNNSALVRLEALDNVHSIATNYDAILARNAHLHVLHNTLLQDIGLVGLRDFQGDLSIQDNKFICQESVESLAERLDATCWFCTGQEYCE